jgi:phospholipase C
VFDHTSVIQFIEKRFGVKETHITPWRRAVSGDLTSALNFKVADRHPPKLPDTDNFVSFVSNGALEPVTQAIIVAGNQPAPNIPVVVPAVQTMPAQEAGQRLARALPYRLQADATVDLATQTVTIQFENAGSAGAFFQVRSAEPAQNAGQGTGPWGYTVDPVRRVLSDRWSPTAGAAYDLSVYGPNGFFRRMAGGMTRTSANIEVRTLAELAGEAMVLIVENFAATPTTVTVADQYSGRQERLRIEPRGRITVPVLIATRFRWYDLLITDNADSSFVRHYAGHVENGFDSVTDPHIGAA